MEDYKYYLLNENNMDVGTADPAQLIFADMVYENQDFRWVDHWWKYLANHGIFIIMTDFHTVSEIDHYLIHNFKDAFFVNHLVWKNEWGNHPKDRFHQCYDDILIFCKGNDWKFYPDRIQVPKATAKTKLNPSGRETKTATAWIDDICLTTTSSERVKKDDGHLIRWQKPLKLMDRIIAPFTDENDLVVDLFMGSGTLAEWSIRNKRKYIGIEIDKEVFGLAKKRVENITVT